MRVRSARECERGLFGMREQSARFRPLKRSYGTIERLHWAFLPLGGSGLGYEVQRTVVFDRDGAILSISGDGMGDVIVAN